MQQQNYKQKRFKRAIRSNYSGIKAKSGEGGRLFGSVSTKQIADALQKSMVLK